MIVDTFLGGMTDNDLYKASMQQAVLALHPDALAEYEFTDRNPNTVYTEEFVAKLRKCIDEMSNFALTGDEYNWMKQSIPYFTPWYVEYLRNYRYDPDEVSVSLVNNRLHLNIKGYWHRTILWEVPLMALISGLWFEMNDGSTSLSNTVSQINRCHAKIEAMEKAGLQWADFGTRRRRSFYIQNLIVETMSSSKGFVGTSNILFAMKHGVKPIGTKAHEWYQAFSQLAGLEHANRAGLEAWIRVYGTRLGIALTDTYGTRAFLRDFNRELAQAYDGIRHDSGDPFEFVDNFVAHYKSLGIDPLSKTAIFSDSLTVEKAIKIHEYCKGKIKDSYGIGTHFTNDFPNSVLKPLNIVIKLVRMNNKPVVKLSDDLKKAVGDLDAIRVARYVHMNIPLDTPLTI